LANFHWYSYLFVRPFVHAGVRVLNELIFECQRSLEGIEHARLDLDARGWARGMGLRE